MKAKERLRFILCGAAGDGKSTLLDRLPRGSGTGDFASRHFETEARQFIAIDAPGDERHTRNMVAGASDADLAVILVDAEKGVSAQTRRHGYIAALTGIRRAILAVNKMDLVGYDRDVFAAIAGEYRGFARELRMEEPIAVPLSALTGDNVLAALGGIPWHDGPTLMEALETVDIRIGRGDAIADGSPQAADQFAVHVIWMDARPMLPERPYLFRFAGGSAVAQVTDLTHRVDVDTLGRMAAKTLQLNDIGYCKISLDRPVPFDASAGNRRTGAFALIDRFTDATVGAGAIRFALRRAGNIAWREMKVDKAARARAIGQRPCILWLTGLPGAGKSTIADRLEQKLQAQGKHTYVLDGDNVRHGLSRDLGFTDRDRVENIRRVAEVAKLMVDAGLIVIVSFISPFRSERRMARASVEEREFVEIFVDTPIEVCEARDPKGLYAKARRGDLANFTGIDSPYEPPEDPELRIDTTEMSADQAAEEVLRLLRTRRSG